MRPINKPTWGSGVPGRHEVVREGEHSLTVLCPFTRPWAVDAFFDALEASDVPLERASFIAYVDSHDTRLLAHITDRARALPCPDVRVHFSGWPPPAEKAKRRFRHAAMRLATQALVGDGELLLLEDDTLIPERTYGPLAALGARWAIGVQVGRWGVCCNGLWHVEADGARTLLHGETDCNATGLYCVLTTGEVYRSLDVWHWDDTRGHDVSVTLDLPGIAIAWDVETGHLTENGVITCDMAQRYEVAYRTSRPMNATGAVTPGQSSFVYPYPEEGDMARVRVVKKFKDLTAKMTFAVGDEFEVPMARVRELNATKYGQLVEVIEPDAVVEEQPAPEMTAKDMKAILDARGIEYRGNASKKDLRALLDS